MKMKHNSILSKNSIPNMEKTTVLNTVIQRILLASNN